MQYIFRCPLILLFEKFHFYLNLFKFLMRLLSTTSLHSLKPPLAPAYWYFLGIEFVLKLAFQKI